MKKQKATPYSHTTLSQTIKKTPRQGSKIIEKQVLYCFEMSRKFVYPWSAVSVFGQTGTHKMTAPGIHETSGTQGGTFLKLVLDSSQLTLIQSAGRKPRKNCSEQFFL